MNQYRGLLNTNIRHRLRLALCAVYTCGAMCSTLALDTQTVSAANWLDQFAGFCLSIMMPPADAKKTESAFDNVGNTSLSLRERKAALSTLLRPVDPQVLANRVGYFYKVASDIDQFLVGIPENERSNIATALLACWGKFVSQTDLRLDTWDSKSASRSKSLAEYYTVYTYSIPNFVAMINLAKASRPKPEATLESHETQIQELLHALGPEPKLSLRFGTILNRLSDWMLVSRVNPSLLAQISDKTVDSIFEAMKSELKNRADMRIPLILSQILIRLRENKHPRAAYIDGFLNPSENLDSLEPWFRDNISRKTIGGTPTFAPLAQRKLEAISEWFKPGTPPDLAKRARQAAWLMLWHP